MAFLSLHLELIMRFARYSICLFSILSAPVLASVILTGSRVIYPAAQPAQTLQFSNMDKYPYLMQIWLDTGAGDNSEQMGTPDAPFTVSPPIFRMEPGSRQAVRLINTDEQVLPRDRESVFYLNFTQIPAFAQDELEYSQLVMLLKSRVKVFYRPRKLSRPDTRKLACGLRFHMDGTHVAVENPAAFHAVIRSVEWNPGEKGGKSLLAGQMLPPFSQQYWPLTGAFVQPATDAQVQVTLVNDYGADEVHTCPSR